MITAHILSVRFDHYRRVYTCETNTIIQRVDTSIVSRSFPGPLGRSSALRLPAPYPQPRQPLAVFCHQTFVFSAVLYNGIIHFVLGLASLTQHHYFEIHPSYLVYQEFILFLNC